MKLTVNKSGETVKAIIMELTPAEALIVNHAMRRYTEDEDVNQRDREEMDKMLFTKPRFSEIPNMSENPTSSEAEEKLAALYTWLNDVRLGIAPDETTPEDERGERQAQVDVIDQIMEWMEEQGI